MNKKANDTNITDQPEGAAEASGFFSKFKDKLKHGKYTCPFCKEVQTGFSALGAHLKQHCT